MHSLCAPEFGSASIDTPSQQHAKQWRSSSAESHLLRYPANRGTASRELSWCYAAMGEVTEWRFI